MFPPILGFVGTGPSGIGFAGAADIVGPEGSPLPPEPDESDELDEGDGRSVGFGTALERGEVSSPNTSCALSNIQ